MVSPADSLSPFTAEDLFDEDGELFALDAAAATAVEEEEPTVAAARGDTVAAEPPSFEIT